VRTPQFVTTDAPPLRLAGMVILKNSPLISSAWQNAASFPTITHVSGLGAQKESRLVGIGCAEPGHQYTTVFYQLRGHASMQLERTGK